MKMDVIKSKIEKILNTKDINIQSENNKIIITGMNDELDIVLIKSGHKCLIHKLKTPWIDSEKQFNLIKIFRKVFE